MKNLELSKKIKELRTRKGLSQEELSEDSGLSLRTIQRIENGETEPSGDGRFRSDYLLFGSQQFRCGTTRKQRHLTNDIGY